MKNHWSFRHSLLRGIASRPVETAEISYPELIFVKTEGRYSTYCPQLSFGWTWYGHDRVAFDESYWIVCGAFAPTLSNVNAQRARVRDPRIHLVVGCTIQSSDDLRDALTLHVVPPRQCYSIQIRYEAPEESGSVKLYGWTVPWDEYQAMVKV